MGTRVSTSLAYQNKSAYSRSSHSTQILSLKPSPLLITSEGSNGSGNVTGLKFESHIHTQSRTCTLI